MVIKPLTPIMFGSNQPYYFDQDTKTLPELCALLHGKMNETVAAFNELEADLHAQQENFIESARSEMALHDSALRQEFQDFIDIVDLKLRATDNFIKDFTQYVEGILTALTERVAALESKVNG